MLGLKEEINKELLSIKNKKEELKNEITKKNNENISALLTGRTDFPLVVEQLKFFFSS